MVMAKAVSPLIRTDSNAFSGRPQSLAQHDRTANLVASRSPTQPRGRWIVWDTDGGAENFYETRTMSPLLERRRFPDRFPIT